MNTFGKNIKFLRNRKKLSQQSLADELNLKRSTLSSYEIGVQAPYDTLIAIADYFGFSLDALVRYDLSALSAFQLSELDKGFEIDLSGSRLRLLTISTDNKGRENIELVSAKAQAGYTQGYGDPEFIAELPKFQLPFLDKNKSYRCFQIVGDSMLPIPEKSWITAQYLEDWNTIKNGEKALVVTQNDGIVFKHLYLKPEQQGLTLSSSNPLYKPYFLPFSEIKEIWLYATHNSPIQR